MKDLILLVKDCPTYLSERFTRFQAILDLILSQIENGSKPIEFNLSYYSKRWRWLKFEVEVLFKLIVESGGILISKNENQYMKLPPVDVLLLIKWDDSYLYPWEDDRFKKHWDLWLQYRRERRLPKYTPTSLSLTYNKLLIISQNDSETACKIIIQSIENGWQGLFQLKSNKNAKQNYSWIKDKIRGSFQ